MNPGDVFNRLTAVRYLRHTLPGKQQVWLFTCSCGRSTETLVVRVQTGRTKSCGCLRDETARAQMTTHGLSGGVEYDSWRHMWWRCTKVKEYIDKSITVCDAWKDLQTFLRDMGHCPVECYSIDRIDNSKGYYKENCRWANRSTQQLNKG